MLVEDHRSSEPEAIPRGIVELRPASPLVGSQHIGEEEHQLLLIAGARLVQWADDIAHYAGNRFGPGVSGGTAP